MPKIKTVRIFSDHLNSYFHRDHYIMNENETRYDFIELVQKKDQLNNKIYCSTCKNGFVLPNEIKEYRLKKRFFKDDDSKFEEAIVGYECPTCKKRASVENCIQINELSSSIHCNEYPVWADVINDDLDDTFVKFKWITVSYSAFNDKLQAKSHYYYMVFNIKTGNTYYFEPQIKSDTTNQFRKAPWYIGPRIKNVSYCFERDIFPDKFIPETLRIKLYEFIYKKIVKNLGYAPNNLECYYQRYRKKEKLVSLSREIEKFSFQDIILYNRQPNLNPLLYRTLINKSRRGIKHRKETINKFVKEHQKWQSQYDIANKKEQKKLKLNEPRLRSTIMDAKITNIKNTDCNPIGSLMKNFKVQKNNSFRKIILNNYDDVFRLEIMLDYFKDVNNVRKLMDTNMFNHIDYFSWKNKKSDSGYYHNYKIETELFIKDMISKFGETILVNKIINGNSSHFRDTAEMYYKLKLRKVFEISYLDKIKICYTQKERDNFITRQKNNDIQCSIRKTDIPINLNGNLTEIHDNLSELSDMLDHPNFGLRDSYNEENLKLETETKDYIIKLADDTHELRRAGRAMHICVGSYGDRVMKGQCNIVLMINKATNDYVMCLELSSDFKNVYQAKAECNYYPEGKEKEIIMKWIEEHELIVKTNDLPELCVEDAGYYRARQRPQVNENGLNLAAAF